MLKKSILLHRKLIGGNLGSNGLWIEGMCGKSSFFEINRIKQIFNKKSGWSTFIQLILNPW